jgi:hypothetical protein
MASLSRVVSCCSVSEVAETLARLEDSSDPDITVTFFNGYLPLLSSLFPLHKFAGSDG